MVCALVPITPFAKPSRYLFLYLYPALLAPSLAIVTNISNSVIFITFDGSVA